MAKWKITLTLFGFAVILSLATCSLLLAGTPSKVTTRIDGTALAQTVVAQLTQMATQQSPTETSIPPTPTQPAPSPTDPPPSTPTASQTLPPSPSPTSQPVRCNWAQFVKDVTVPDGTMYAPGDKFTKTWRLKNIGSCSWNQDYDLVFSRGDLMGGVIEISLPGIVRSGETIDLSVELVAPGSQGEYRGDWMLRDPAGRLFGLGKNADGAFWVAIKVSASTRQYTNTELGYSIVYPADWTLDEHGLSQASKEIILSPPNPEPFISYLSILIDPRNLEEIQRLYADSVPDAEKTRATFAGRPVIQYDHPNGRLEIYVPYKDRVYMISTDRPTNPKVADILTSFTFR